MACNDAFGYGWDDEQSRHIVYRDPGNYHLHELRGSVTGQKQWIHTDLTEKTGAPPSDCFSNGYAWKAGKSVQVVFSTYDDGHIHELYRTAGGTWQHADLTDKTKAPPMTGAHALTNAYAWDFKKSKQIVYWDLQSQHIIELFVIAGDPKGWQWADLTAIAGAPNVSNHSYVVNGYAWEGLPAKQVVFWDLSGQIHELYTTGGQWQYANLTQIAKAPAATAVINGYAWESGHSKQVVYIGPNGHIFELYTTGGAWSYADLTDVVAKNQSKIPAVQTVVNGYAFEAGKSKHVAYRHESSRVYELSVSVGGSWGWDEATTALPQSGGGILPISPLHAYSWDLGKSRQIIFSDGHMNELIFALGGSKWTVADRSAQAGL